MPSTRGKRTSPTEERKRHLPPVVPGRPAPERFDAKTVLRRTGFRLHDEARAASVDTDKARAALSDLGATDIFGGVSDLTLTIVGSVLGLIFLDVLISKRGPTITGDALGWISGGIARLVSPTDPIVGAPAPAGNVNVINDQAAVNKAVSNAAAPTGTAGPTTMQPSPAVTSHLTGPIGPGAPPTTKTGTAGAGG